MRYVLRDGKLIEKHLAPLKNEARKAHYVISDTMEPLKHQATGAIIDSKAKFREHTRMAGCVEVGTDPAASRAQPRHQPSINDIVTDVRRAMQESNR